MIKDVTYVSDHILKITFTDGQVRVIDFLPLIKKRAIWKRFLKIENFKKFRFDKFAIEWPSNLMDFYYEHLLNMEPVAHEN